MPPLLFCSQFCCAAPGGSCRKVLSHLHFACPFSSSERLSFTLTSLYSQLRSEPLRLANPVASLFLSHFPHGLHAPQLLLQIRDLCDIRHGVINLWHGPV